jgi:hypothetical protein
LERQNHSNDENLASKAKVGEIAIRCRRNSQLPTAEETDPSKKTRKSPREREENVWKKHEDFRENVIMLDGSEEPTSVVKNERHT